jgi:hypothetical protein
MHRLQQFTVGTIAPELDKLRLHPTIENDPSAAMVSFSMIEAFLWLHLGVEVGAFPTQASDDVYKAYYLPFFQSLSRAHSFQSSAIYLALPEFARALIGKAMRQEMPFKMNYVASAERKGWLAHFKPFDSLFESV